MNNNYSPKYFTRHLLRAGLQCPAKLYYKSHDYPENNESKPFLAHAGFNKYQLKKLSGLCYPNATLINNRSRLKAAKRTSTLLEQPRAILLNAVFITGKCYAKVPVLIKEESELTLVDVQTKAINPYKHHLVNHHGKIHQKWEAYIIDMAYKLYCIQDLYPHLPYEARILLPDKRKKSVNDQLLRRLNHDTSKLSSEELLYSLDVTEHVNYILTGKTRVEPFADHNFGEVLDEMKTRFFRGDWDQPTIGRKCGNCEFCISQSQIDRGERSGFHRCWKEAPEVPGYAPYKATVLDLIGPGVNNLLNDGIYLQKDIPYEDLSSLQSINGRKDRITHKQRQTLQVYQAQGHKVPSEIIKKPIIDEINRWEFPLHFLDFEAGNYAVPVRSNRSPYHLVVFQFSCHTLCADGSQRHHQWINREPERYPNYELIRQLMKVPQIEQGTIIQYSNFEHFALKTIRKELKKESDVVDDVEILIHWLNKIVQRHDSNYSTPPYLADLSRLVKRYYYNWQMQDSLSIKDVLQSILTVSERLKEKYSRSYKSDNFDNIQWWQWDEAKKRTKNPYQILTNIQPVGIGRGTEAMVTYAKFLRGSLEQGETVKAFDALHKYCELDTLAMVMIYEHWKSCSKTTK